MPICPMCGSDSTAQICHYHTVIEEGWSTSNRIMCDFVHRHLVPPRLPEQDREGRSHSDLDPD